LGLGENARDKVRMEPGGGFSDGKVSGLSHPSPSSPILVSPLSTIERGGNAHHLLNTSK